MGERRGVWSLFRVKKDLCVSDWEGSGMGGTRALPAWGTFALYPSLTLQLGSVFSALLHLTLLLREAAGPSAFPTSFDLSYD